MIFLKKDRDKSVRNRHPWIFSGAIEKVDDPNTSGIDVIADCEGRFLAWGYYDADSHIPVHVMSLDEDRKPDEYWWADMLKASILRRREFFEKGKNSDTTTFRLVHGESDFLGGLTVDVYGTVVRMIISSRLAYHFKDVSVKTVQSFLAPSMIIVNTDPSFCSVEKLPSEIEYYENGVRFQPESRLNPIRIKESGLIYELIPGTGQKSGFFCDQRENRNMIERYCKDAVVMDGCSYTGGFTLHAIRGGATRVDAFDSSDDALHMLLANVQINEESGVLPKGSRDKVTVTKCDIFQQIREIPENEYDVIILDPPKLAATKSAADKAMRAYKDLNRVAMGKIRNGGIVVTCSCSGAISVQDFQMVLGWAAKDAGVNAQILQRLSQGTDHPVLVSFPESEYLKVMIMRVIK